LLGIVSTHRDGLREMGIDELHLIVQEEPPLTGLKREFFSSLLSRRQ
jgi:hypothetical protein